MLFPFRKILTFVFSLCLLVLIAGSVWVWVVSVSLPDVRFLADPGASFEITVMDWQGNRRPFTVGPENPEWVSLSGITEHLYNAVLAGEEFSF